MLYFDAIANYELDVVFCVCVFFSTDKDTENRRWLGWYPFSMTANFNTSKGIITTVDITLPLYFICISNHGIL